MLSMQEKIILLAKRAKCQIRSKSKNEGKYVELNDTIEDVDISDKNLILQCSCLFLFD